MLKKSVTFWHVYTQVIFIFYYYSLREEGGVGKSLIVGVEDNY